MIQSEELFRPITLKRATIAGSYVNGTYQQPTFVTTTILACVQPLGPKEVLNLPEAQRTRKSYRVFTDAELKVLDGLVPCDRLVIDSKEYEVFKVENWTKFNLELVHYESIAVESNE